ncbi:P-loop containing nucleoside triphosphate hydrolase protein [Lyophyllum atratum]|nr:P-loop containing nucleoside triphosphate hydrolase protein [Lyophyllum atratum]
MPGPPPKGTRRRQQQHQGTINTSDPQVPTRKACTDEELVGLKEKITTQFNWKDGPKDFQMKGINAQLQMRDALVHAGTGSGKTGIAAGPHVHPSMEGRITLMVSPLIALHDEMVETFRDEFRLNATAVNSSNGGCAPDKLKKITQGNWQVVLISPELVLSRRFIQDVLKHPELKRRVLSVVVDEAHVISHWGNGFRKKYGELGILRSFLPKSTPIVAVSATLAARVRRDVLRVLRFHQNEYEDIDVGNDRPNVSIVIRSIHHPLNSYADLDFVINEGAQDRHDILKTFVYCDNIAMGTEIIDHLTDILPRHLRKLGLIRPYNACFSKEYRRAAMTEFRAGRVRILVCTDAAGMGCNLPDIDLVVQWKVPKSISAFVQRAGRAARALEKGLAVLLAEPSVYSTVLNEHGGRSKPKPQAKRGKPTNATLVLVDKVTAEETKAKRNYAIARGVKRGGADKKHDAVLVRDCPPIDPEAEDEGLVSLVQSGTCRRAILTKVYNNKPAEPTVPCCDICEPWLLDLTRPGEAPKSAARRKKIKTEKAMLTPSAVLTPAMAAGQHEFRISDYQHVGAHLQPPSFLQFSFNDPSQASNSALSQTSTWAQGILADKAGKEDEEQSDGNDVDF